MMGGEQGSPRRRIVLLGSTGSIGRQTLEVVRSRSGRLAVEALTAHSNWELLVRQAREFRPRAVAIGRAEHYSAVKDALRDLPVEVLAGTEALSAVAAGRYEAAAGTGPSAGGYGAAAGATVLNALVGFAGLEPTLEALRAGRTLALANKESLVAGGKAVTALTAAGRGRIIPVDSEHSAIFQCLVGEPSSVRRIIVTASGGPFLRTPLRKLREVTPTLALKHPRWAMGRRITVDSATMFNKGFEVIEARWLFAVPAERIEVLIHPQAAVHSMVEFADGAVKAQIGTPDMRLPISYALTWPDREEFGGGAFDFTACGHWTFEAPDAARFPALEVAYGCLRRGGTAACTMNAADEVAVAAFLDGRIRFTDIVRTVERTLREADFSSKAGPDELGRADAQARTIAEKIVERTGTRNRQMRSAGRKAGL